MAETDSYFKRLVCGPAFSPGEEMKYEVARLASFTTWPPWACVRPTELASVGMYYTGNGDHVSCFSCGSDMGEWQPGQRPEAEHRRRSPGCALVLGRDTDNVPFPAVPDSCAPEADGEDSSDASAENPGHSETSGTGSSTLPQETSCTHKGLEQLYSIMPELRDVNQRVDSDPDLQGKSFAEQMEVLMADDPLPRSVPESVVRSLSTSQAPENSRTFTSSSPATGRADIDMTKVNRESYRLSTFQGWPEASFVGPPELAKNGFYYLGSLDRVKCAFCNGTLRNWRPEDDVKQEHRRHIRFCPFVRGMDVNNITLEAELQQTSGANAMEQDPEASGVLTERPRQAAYVNEASRAATFTNWPKSNVISPSVLARAGFFYIGYGDNCMCFFCDGVLRNWESSDDPWFEHARWFPQCGFLRMCKGEDYIRAIQAHYDDRTPASSSGVIAVPPRPTGDTEAGAWEILGVHDGGEQLPLNRRAVSHLVTVSPPVRESSGLDFLAAAMDIQGNPGDDSHLVTVSQPLNEDSATLSTALETSDIEGNPGDASHLVTVSQPLNEDSGTLSTALEASDIEGNRLAVGHLMTVDQPMNEDSGRGTLSIPLEASDSYSPVA